VTEPKLHGVSLSVRYERVNHNDSSSVSSSTSSDTILYELTRATTRGDGHLGRDVTATIGSTHLSSCIPWKLCWKLQLHSGGSISNLATLYHDVPSIIEIRGEVILPTSQFNLYQQRHEQQTTRKTTPVATTPAIALEVGEAIDSVSNHTMGRQR
jgi:NAD-dependent DNA ligase